MEIGLYILSAIGAAAVLLFFYISVRQVLENTEGVEDLKRWHRSLDQSVDKAHDRYYALATRLDELEGAVSGQIAEEIISSRSRRRK